MECMALAIRMKNIFRNSVYILLNSSLALLTWLFKSRQVHFICISQYKAAYKISYCLITSET